jgi:phosphatidylinositol-3-phosphatase
VIFENHDSDSVLGSGNAPYINRLAGLCASATAYRGVAHPSLPNYIAMTSGSTHGIEDDEAPSAHPVDGPSLFSQVQNWRALQEGMTQPCQRGNTGRYAVKHNPAAYYTGLAGECAARDTALAAPPDLSARFTFITPDLCHDMHDCGVRAGDEWLAGWLPGVLAGPQYRAGKTAVFVTFDEDEGHNDQLVPFIAVAPSVGAGSVAGADFDHYAMLRTTQEMLGLSPYLGAAATAASMRSALRV